MHSIRRHLRSARALLLVATSAAVLSAAVACAGEDETTAPGAARLTIDSTSLNFGTRMGDTIPTRTLTVRNVGDGVSEALTVSLSSGTEGFAVAGATTGSCASHRLAPGASCKVVLSLGGRASGPQSGTLQVIGGSAVGQTVSATLTGLIRSDFLILFAGTGHGTVTASPASAAVSCASNGCSTTGAGASCSSTCTLRFESPVATLVATPDANSTFGGFVRAANELPCTGGVAGRCTLELTDLNSVTAVFTAK